MHRIVTRIIVGSLLALSVASAAEAAYPANHPCVQYQYVDAILGAWSRLPVPCPPSSFTHHMAWGHRRPEWVEAPGSPGGFGGGPASGSGMGMGHGHGGAAAGGHR